MGDNLSGVGEMRRVLVFTVMALIGVSGLMAFAFLKIAEHRQRETG